MPLTRTAVVVGAGPGLGLALARRFAREGYALALLARAPERLDRADVPEATLHAVDLADRGALAEALAEVRRRHGDPEVLAFNASATVMGTPSEVPPDAVADALAVGVVAGVLCAQQLAPAMRAAGAGSLLFTGGGTALAPWGAAAAIGMQKAALRNYVLALHDEVAPFGVHAGTVTVRGMIAAGTPFAPELIAEAFWALHTQPRASWAAELDFTGGPPPVGAP
jgi:NAD(P)-dependent dehydrogenase (short-subunit alcohol dehydrogenase family)